MMGQTRLICFYGPESTGKSVLAPKVAHYFQTEWVPEVARELITSNIFTIDDIVRIGEAQTQRVLEKSKTTNRVLICDTDLITTQIYCRHYLGVIPDVLFQLEKKIQYDLYFLFDTDVPWVSDGMRDLRENRKEMFQVFKSELDKRKLQYILVQGNYEQREELVKREIEKLITSFS
jgi:HTH-type transcriptional regulator, transcriptional repressor of NAD biosynthesis genes